VALINRVPVGLLSLLGIRAGGQNPAVLEDQVRPVIDLTALYLASFIERNVDSNNVTVVGAFASNLIVPQGEAWYVHRYTIITSAALGAGQAFQIAPAYAFSFAGATRMLQLGPASNLGAVGDSVSAGALGFIAPPGAALGGIVHRIAAGPIVGVLWNVEFTRLQI